MTRPMTRPASTSHAGAAVTSLAVIERTVSPGTGLETRRTESVPSVSCTG
jgi:hypothetical protein